MPTKEEQYEIVKAKLQAREDHIKESWVKAMELKLVGQELGKCHLAEGVNHYENCKWLSEKYMEMLKTNRLQGYKHVDLK